MRAAGEKLAQDDHKMAPLVLKLCDIGDEVCRSYLDLYKYIDSNPEEFGSSAVKKKYETEIKPMEEKRDSLARLLKEQCETFFHSIGVLNG
jgi:hypothetical protein